MNTVKPDAQHQPVLAAGLRRPRRLRKTEALREMICETHLEVSQLIQPLFVMDGDGTDEPIASLPGQIRFRVPSLVEECRRIARLGIRGVALFPKIDSSLKSSCAREALNPETLVLRAVKAVKAAVPELLLFTDIALDPYTSHGHDGLLRRQGTQEQILNDETVEVLCRMAVLNAQAGADFVAPSDMMDGRVGAIRRALDSEGLSLTGILAYSAKFASAYYGPFRDAVGSRLAGASPLDKRTYQMDPANRLEALLECRLDEEEGADILMVKPAGCYLDIIRELRNQTRLPVAAYQVSGEYAQIMAAAERGWLDLKASRDESLLAIRRAGANLVLTYFASQYASDRLNQ